VNDHSMAIYFIPFMASLLLVLCSRLIPRSLTRLLVLFVVLGCIFLAGFRYDSDFDFSNYVQMFEDIPPLTHGWTAFTSAIFGLYIEPTFALMVAIVKIVIPDQCIFLLIAAVSLLLYYRSFCRVTAYPALAFLIYLGDGFYLREFTQIRFGLAVSLGFAGMCALYEGRVSRHRWFIIFACFFHFLSVMMLMTQLWVKLIRTRRSVVTLSTLLLLLTVVGVFEGLIPTLAGVNLAPQRILDHIDVTEDAGKVPAFILMASYGILMWMTRVIRDDEREFFWVSIYALSFAFLCLFSGFDLMRRVSFFFSVAMYVVASYALQRRRFGFVLLSIAYSALLFSARLRILYEYHSWLFQ